MKILLVEDNPADARLTTDFFKDPKFNIKIEQVSDGATALDYLYQKGKYEEVYLPDIIFENCGTWFIQNFKSIV